MRTVGGEALAICVAFGFKLLASTITIYAVTERAAVEIAPASAILTSALGVVAASVIVNVAWAGTAVCAFLLIKRSVHDKRVKRVTLLVSALTVVTVSAADGFWDLGVLLGFGSGAYILPVITFLAAVAVGVKLHRSKRILWMGL